MSAHQSTQWFWSDWAGDQEVRRLTPAERGLWIDLLALAAVGKPAGYVCDQRGNPIPIEEIARFTNASPTEVESLIAGILEKGVGSRDRTGRLFNRRMVRQASKRAEKATAGKLGGDQTRKIWASLKASALERQVSSSPARGSAVADARAPRTAPYQSSNLNSSSVTVAAREAGQATGVVSVDPSQGPAGKEGKNVSDLTRQELDAIYTKRKAGNAA
jgi:hypothetical protein